MRVYVSKEVWRTIRLFYYASMERYPSLSRETVKAKIGRMQVALQELGRYAAVLNMEPYKDSWKQRGYRAFYFEGWAFAYTISQTDPTSPVVLVHDAVHSTLNYNPEDAF